MAKVNLNELAVSVSAQEGGEVPLNIAEIKEVMRIVLNELSLFTDEEIIEVVRR